MKQVELDNTVKMISMLQHLGCKDIGKVFEKINFWSFPMSVASHYEEHGELTPKQQEAMVSLIKDKVGVECIPCEKMIIEHIAQYKREQEQKLMVEKKMVHHNFDDLQSIQLFDLPLEDGEERVLMFYPYNKHSIVVAIAGGFFKIPNPVNFEEIDKPTAIKFSYKRTKMKGFLNQIN